MKHIFDGCQKRQENVITEDWQEDIEKHIHLSEVEKNVLYGVNKSVNKLLRKVDTLPEKKDIVRKLTFATNQYIKQGTDGEDLKIPITNFVLK